MADATPRPWTYTEQEWGDGPIYVLQYEHPDFTVSEIATVWGIDGHERPEMSLPAKENAELIVRAVNNFDDLVAALETVAFAIEHANPLTGPVLLHSECDFILGVLAEARGESS